MNILLPDSWLREFLKNKATAKQISQNLSLCSQSVERTTQVGNDWVYEIEVTTNRPDCLSVYGIARELHAILPRFGIETQLEPYVSGQTLIKASKNLPLEVKINDSLLCPRFTALIFDNIAIKPSPKIVQERLEKAGTRSINNVIDISNYLMYEIGQPMHTFDYDKIKGAKMQLRESKEGEKITTLDGQTHVLPKGVIVMEDGDKRLIDLCGIMGGENSAVDQSTKRVLLFIQTYDPVRIRRACQQLSFRTEAASRFEKGVDPEGAKIAMEKAITMFKENCQAQIVSKLIDIYPTPAKKKIVKLNLDLVNKIMGVVVPPKEVINILMSLGFTVSSTKNSQITCIVPHWRNNDISIPEDLIEEVARIYGYHNLPTNLPPSVMPADNQKSILFWQKKVKEALKYWGYTETLNYSFVGEEDLKKGGFQPSNCLKVANPLTADLVYLRPSLIPSLLRDISKNQEQSENIKIFELAKIYHPRGKNKLPDEIVTITVLLQNDNFYLAKGIVESLFESLNVNGYKLSQQVLKQQPESKIFNFKKSALITIQSNSLGIVGEIDPLIVRHFEVKGTVVGFSLNFNDLITFIKPLKKYHPISKYPAIIEDLAFIINSQTSVGNMLQSIKAVSSIIQDTQIHDIYKNIRTIRIFYQSPQKNLTAQDVRKVRDKIIDKIEKQFNAKLKTL